MKRPLDTRLKGRSLVVKIEDTLAPNTTYSVTFGNSLADNTEGNLLKGFTYVLSTGEYVDTLSLQGNVKMAFDHIPQKDVFVELYINNNDTLPFDSLPFRVAPYYITKTDEQGNFMFHNLQNEQFKLFALADQNGDLIFNQVSEKIAFSDSLVIPYFIATPKSDTAKSDSLQIDPDKAAPVRVGRADSTLYPSYPLFLFEETDSVQRIVKATFPMEQMALLVFRFPVKDLRIVPLNFDSLGPWHIEEMSKNRDSVRLWITKPGLDSLIAKVVVDDHALDTVYLEAPKKDDEAKSSKRERPGSKLGMVNSAAAGGLNQFKNKVIVTFSCPLVRWDFKKVLLIMDKDTVNPEIRFSDSLKRRIIIIHAWEEEKNYRIVIPDSVFFGIRDVSHDTVRMDFRSKGERDFGNLIIAMDLAKRPGRYIVQMINEKETFVYEEHIITESGKVRFDFMPPGKYKIKAIFDRNWNNRWDTGNYRMKIQPEEVLYFKKMVEVRANWDVEETWD